MNWVYSLKKYIFSSHTFMKNNAGMKSMLIAILFCTIPYLSLTQDLTQGLLVNDLELRPMQEINKPDYLQTYIDPSFGTTIRRISDAEDGQGIVPMYSTIQAWNADESRMILYDLSNGGHQLLDGQNYSFIRHLDDVNPADLEQIFWDTDDPDIFYYPAGPTRDFIKYDVSNQTKEILFNMNEVTGCSEFVAMGNDIQMPSWDNDVIGMRCGNDINYIYRISTGALTTIASGDVSYTAPTVGPSGIHYYHDVDVYDENGVLTHNLNQNKPEHSCIGKFSNGNDGLFAVSFAEGPQGGCLGNLIAHDLTTGQCHPIISQDQGYDYSKSGTHISALAHKNTEGGWVAASMIGFEEDGVALLDQELIIAKIDPDDIKVCRIGHHRSDENEFDYWGEPHAVISPLGTRVLFGSDWSGDEDGQSIDSYVVELPSFSPILSNESITGISDFSIYPNPSKGTIQIMSGMEDYRFELINLQGQKVYSYASANDKTVHELFGIPGGVYFAKIQSKQDGIKVTKLIIK